MTKPKPIINPNIFPFSLLIAFALLALISCSPTLEVNTNEDPLIKQDGKFVDWDKVDWKFNRHVLAKAYFFDRLRPDDALRKYREQSTCPISINPLSLEEFLALSADDKKLRRKKAADEYYQAMALRRTLSRGWEIWTVTRSVAVAQHAMSDEMGIITPAIMHLKSAVGLDPGNPYFCYDLGYFAGVIGDRRLQREGFAAGLAALEVRQRKSPNPLWQQNEDLSRLRLRLLMDQAWLDREEGHYPAGLETVKVAMAQMAGDDMRTLPEAREAVLLHSLLVVDTGDVHGARRLAQKLPEWRLPIQKTFAQSVSSAGPVMRKENLEHITSKFARDWVWTMTYLKLEDKDQAMNGMREKNYVTEYPPHLNYRFWRDMGRVLEHFGERQEANRCYGFSIVYHPYFPYFPLEGARGVSRVLDQTGAGQTYYLGFHHFYISGSLFSFAANRVVAMEVATDSTEVRIQAESALDALDICLRKNIRPTSALALRGRVHYRLGNVEAALEDLLRAHKELKADQRPSAEIVKMLAVINFNRKEFIDSRTWLEQYTQMEPTDGFGWALSGLSMAHLGRLDEAVTLLDHSRELDPSALNGWYNLALVYLQQDEVELARVLLAEAKTRFPTNPHITRLQQLIRDDLGETVQMTSGNVEMKTSAADSVWFARSNITSAANVTIGLSTPEIEQLLPELWQRYRLKPNAEHRYTLAQALIQARQSKEVQDLLGPLWPDDLSGEEAVLLLMADRDRQSPARATDLAQRLLRDANPYPDSEFWSLVAVVCLENGRRDAGILALNLACELDPQNVALRAMADAQ
ncbi:MAG: tetratricopeptide repeat protein [Gemmatimonadales bacterium]|nr:tetratricopeptide repeat protein [Gemmatimonadales bacterium]